MLKEKILSISLDKFSFYALLNQLHKTNSTVKFSYINRSSYFPHLHLDYFELVTQSKTSDEYNLIYFKEVEGAIACIDFPEEYIEYEVTYLYYFTIDLDKIAILPSGEARRIKFEYLVGKEVPEEYRKREEEIKMSVNDKNCELVFSIDCNWELFDVIIKNIDIHKNQVISDIAAFKDYERRDSMNQPDGFWESIDNMLED